MQLVIDGAGVLVGTITDGDIRRALLGGRGMDAAVNQCMRETPLVGNSVDEAIALTTNLTGRLRCIPVVDSDGRPWVVVSDAGHSPGLETAMIMAGGFGRRLGGHTANTTKPLLPVAGQPILRHLISDLEEKRCWAHSDCGPLPRRSNQNLCQGNSPPIENWTAGALSILPGDVNGPLMVLNGDIITHTDFGAMALHHNSGARDATIAAAQHEIKIPFGVVE